MATLTYAEDIPAAANNPTDDQPKMKDNTNKLNSIWQEDHYAFNEINSGRSKQVTLPVQNTPGAQTDPASTIYTTVTGTVGSASTNSQAYFKNEDGVFPMNSIRACCTFLTTGSAGAITTLVDHNIVSVTEGASGKFTIVLTTDCVTSSNILVLALTSLGGTPSYTFTNPNLVVTTSSQVGFTVNIVVIQI